jgi:hypothetical protein
MTTFDDITADEHFNNLKENNDYYLDAIDDNNYSDYDENINSEID